MERIKIRQEKYYKLWAKLYNEEYKLLSSNAKLVYCWLKNTYDYWILERGVSVTEYGGYKYITMSLKYIVDKTNFSRNVVLKSIEELENFELINVVRPGPRITNSYRPLPIPKNITPGVQKHIKNTSQKRKKQTRKAREISEKI